MNREDGGRKVYHWSLNQEELSTLVGLKECWGCRSLNEALQQLLQRKETIGLQNKRHVKT